MTQSAMQMALPLAWPADPRDDAFLITPSNAHAAQTLEQVSAWPVMTAILTGPRKSGRSLLARIFAARTGGAIIDDAMTRSDAELFHAWNRAQEDRRPLLLVADLPPPGWTVRLPDLRSRLAASPIATIGEPDDQLMRALFERGFWSRGLDARNDLLDWLAARVERSHVAAMRVIDALDQTAMESRKRLSIPLARTALAAAALVSDSADEAP